MSNSEERVLIIAPVGQDAAAVAAMLASHGLNTMVCGSAEECIWEICKGAGALLLTEEALELAQIPDFLNALKAQPPWSEFPLLVLTSGGESRLTSLLDMVAEAARSVTLLERPMGTATLLRSVQVALRFRRRQYQVRDLIDAQRRNQQRLRESEERARRQLIELEAIYRTVPLGLAVFDKDLHYLRVNERLAEMNGLPAQEHVGKTIREVVPSLNEQAEAVLRRVLEAGQPIRSEFKGATRTQPEIERVWDEWWYPLLNQAGEIMAIGVVAEEITERKRVEADLAMAQRELQKYAVNLEKAIAERTADLRSTNEQLETFVYSVAHDLRAPLRSMAGYSQLLLDDHARALDETGQHLLKRIQASSEFMDKLLLDLLAYGRTARAEMELEPVPVEKAWETALYQCASQIERTEAEIETRQPLPTVRAHEATLGQVLANLLSNALKFVPAGQHPHIQFWAEERQNNARLWIQDDGIGIPQDQMGRVFRVFERLNGARYPGTGIGLSVVRKGVERMDGKVGVESEPGKGSRFWVELPTAW